MGSQLHASASSFEPRALQKEKHHERNKEEDDVFVVGLIGNSFQEVSQLLTSLSGIVVSPEDAAPLLPGSQQQQHPHDRTAHAVHDKWTRTQYLLVAPPRRSSSSSSTGSTAAAAADAGTAAPASAAAPSSLSRAGSRGGPVEAALAAAEAEVRLHLSQLLAFLSCHVVVWAPPGGAVAPQLLGRLRSLQTCKETLAPALGLSADKKGGGSSSAAGGRGGGGQRGRGRGRGSGGRDSGRGAGAAQQQEPEPPAAKDSAQSGGPWSLGASPPPLLLALAEGHRAPGQQAWYLVKKARLLPHDAGSPSALFSLASSAAFALEGFPCRKGGPHEPRGAHRPPPPPPHPRHQADDPLLGAAEEAVRLLLLLGDDQSATEHPGRLLPLAEEATEDPQLQELRELLLGPSRSSFPSSLPAASSSSSSSASAPPAPCPPAAAWLSAVAEAAAAMEAAAAGCRKSLLRPSPAPSEKKVTQKKAAGQQSLSQRLPEAVSLLAACAAPELRFSVQSCSMAEELGKEAYLKGLPERYPAAVHAERLSGAIKAYTARAAGLLAAQQRARLEAACLALWQDGRQLCGAVSLSGRPCLLPPHPSSRAHDSGQEWVRASAGGTLQLVLPDEFDLAAANRLIEEPADDPGADARDTAPIGGAITVVAGKQPGPASRIFGGGGGSGSGSLGPLTRPCSSGWVLVGLGGPAEAERHSSSTQPGFVDEATQLHVLEFQLEKPRAEGPKQKAKPAKQEQWPSLGGNRGPTRKQQEQQQKQEEEAAKKLAEEELESLRRQLQELWPAAGRKQQQQQRGGGDPQHLPAANGSRGPGGKKGQNHRGKQQQSADGSKGGATQQGKQKQKDQEPPQLQSCSLQLGWEYACGRGCRFLLTPDLLPVPPGPDSQKRYNNNNNNRIRQQQQQRGVEGKHAAALLLTRHLPVFLECPHCAADASDEDDDEYSSEEEEEDEYDDGAGGRSGRRGRGSRSRKTRAKDGDEDDGGTSRPAGLAQLSRFFCLTPDEPLRLASRPLVHFSGPMPPPLPAPTRPAGSESSSSSSSSPGPPPGAPGARVSQQQQPPPGEGFPAPGELACLSFSPAEAVRLPPSSFVAVRFPAAYGLGTPASPSRGSDKQPDDSAPGERPLVQVSPRQPFAAWLEAGSVLFPA